jgi:hypothetical protein
MMTRRTLGLILTALLAAAAPAPGQEKYDIKLKKLGVGETGLVEKTEHETNTARLVDNAGKKLKDLGTQERETKFVYRETVVAKPADARRPTKLKRQYEKAEVTSDGKTTALPYQGKTVLIEQRDDRYHFRVEGGDELTGPDAAALDREFNQKKGAGPAFEELLLPGRPVGVAQTWQPNTAAIVKELQAVEDGPQPDPAGVFGTARLVKVYTKDGRRFGLLRVELTVPLKALPAGKGLELETGTQLVIHADLDLCIDGGAARGTVTSRVNMDLRARVKDQANTRLIASTKATLTEVHK